MVIIDFQTTEDIIEEIFFRNGRRRTRNLHYKGEAVSVVPEFHDALQEKLETIRIRRKRENGRRCYEKHRESRLEREKTRYHLQKCGPYEPKQPGRPKKEKGDELECPKT